VVTNQAGTGLLTVNNGAFRFHGGLINNGALAITAGDSDVFGEVTDTGTIVVTGGASATFNDHVTHNGTIQIEATGGTSSVAVFIGGFSGSGSFTGGGDIFFPGDLRPGDSPGQVSFENNIVFGADALLEFELAGLLPGDEYDQLINALHTQLDGTLRVLLEGGYQPTFGDVFELIRSGTIDDAGLSFDLPELAGNLSLEPMFVDGRAGGQSLQLRVVPEPGALTLCLIGAATLLMRRRRAEPTPEAVAGC